MSEHRENKSHVVIRADVCNKIGVMRFNINVGIKYIYIRCLPTYNTGMKTICVSTFLYAKIRLTSHTNLCVSRLIHWRIYHLLNLFCVKS